MVTGLVEESCLLDELFYISRFFIKVTGLYSEPLFIFFQSVMNDLRDEFVQLFLEFVWSWLYL